MTTKGEWPSKFGAIGEKYGLNDLPDRDGMYRNILDDYLPPMAHPRTGEIISSKKLWNYANHRTGLVEYDGEIKKKRVSEEELSRDVEQAMERAIYAADNGQSVLSDKAREHYREVDRRMSEVHGVDLTNIFKANRR